jgi:hypothetical protein
MKLSYTNDKKLFTGVILMHINLIRLLCKFK